VDLVHLGVRSAQAGDEAARVRELARRSGALEDTLSDRGVREGLITLPGDPEDVGKHEAHPRIVGIERHGSP
jgi:hypothetical protein